jgi:hypothetical protein
MSRIAGLVIAPNRFIDPHLAVARSAEDGGGRDLEAVLVVGRISDRKVIWPGGFNAIEQKFGGEAGNG